VLVHDELEPCPYLARRKARMPLRLPLRPLTPEETDVHLARGDRRHGRLLYRPACPRCSACEPMRLDVERFQPSRSQRRVLRRGHRELRTEIGDPDVDERRLELYDAHKRGRGLVSGSGRPIDERSYFGFLVDRCVDAFELRYFVADRLVGVAVTDRGETALSAVYCYFDPAFSRLGIGTFSILRQVELCREWGLRHLYLGLYIAQNEHMSYKARFRPHERLVDGEWVEHRS